MSWSEASSAPQLHPYRWVILGVMFAVHFVLNGAILITGGMAASLMGMFDLTTQQYSLCMSVPFLAGFVFGIPAGAAADRVGIRKVMVFALLVATAGAVWRVFAVGFWTLFISSFIMGIAMAALNANSTKIMRLWFPGRFISAGMGIYVAGATLGSALVIGVGQFVPVRPAFAVCAALLGACALLWALFEKPHPDGEGTVRESVVEHLGVVCRSRGLWVTCLLMFLVMGLSLVQNSFQLVALTAPVAQGGLDFDPVLAAALASATNVSVSVGGLIVPAIAGAINRVKPVIIGAAVAVAALIAAAWFSGNVLVTFVSFLFNGMLMGGLIPVSKTLPSLLGDIRPEHLGAAGGLQSTCQNLGAFVVPSYIVTPLAGGNYMHIMVGAMAIALLVALVACLHKETGATPRV